MWTGLYCCDYIAWRKGEAKGAKGEPLGAVRDAEADRWEWRATISYWASVTFCWGSCVFTVASAFWFDVVAKVDSGSPVYSDSCVGIPFTIGCVIFLVGCMLGWIEVINSDPKHSSEIRTTRVWASWSTFRGDMADTGELGAAWWSYTGSMAYLVGAVVYMVACLAAVSYVNVWVTGIGMSAEAFFWTGALSNISGGLCFWYGGACEMIINDWTAFRFEEKEWWVSGLNGLGGFLFFVSGAGGIVVPKLSGLLLTSKEGLALTTFTQVLPCFVGSVAYAIASVLCIWMWKNDQYGLGLIRWMNHHTTAHLHKKVGRKQFVVLLICNLAATAATTNLGIGLAWGNPLDASSIVFRATCCIAEMCGFFLLFSFLHRTPKVTPAHLLMVVARYALLPQPNYSALLTPTPTTTGTGSSLRPPARLGRSTCT